MLFMSNLFLFNMIFHHFFFFFFFLFYFCFSFFFFFQAEDGIRDLYVTGVQTCALPISLQPSSADVDLIARDPHRRYNPLLDEWVLVSAGRTRRPWLGRRERPTSSTAAEYDPTCYLCPGNKRANGEVNPDYETTFVFTNDFAALRPDVPPQGLADGLLRAETEPGTCRVVCFARRHDLTLADMDREAVRRVVDLWSDQTADLGDRWQRAH